MAAVAFVIPYPIVALPTNVGAPGAKLYFYSPGTTTIVPVYASSALTTQLPNPVIADSAGRTVAIWLNGANTYKLVIKSKSGAVLYTQDPLTPGTVTSITGPAGDVAKASTRTDLAAVTGASTGTVRWLVESGREGVFVFDSSDLSAKVTADSLQGIYVAPATATTGASGAWVRQFKGPIYLEWFGAKTGDSTAGGKTANDNALTAALAFDVRTYDTFYATTGAWIQGLAGEYYFSANHWNAKAAFTLRGAGGSAGPAGYLATRFIGPVNWKGIICQSYDTIDETTAASTTGAAGFVIEGIHFIGNANAQTSLNSITAGQGVEPRCPGTIRGCRFELLWNGIFSNTSSTSGGATEGQASGLTIRDNWFVQNRNWGIELDGGDTNAFDIAGNNYIANGRGGLKDSSFLGGLGTDKHFRDNGCRTDYWNVSSQCFYSGSLYYVNETATLTTSDASLRTGNPSSNSLWTSVGAGVASSNYPDFTTFVGTFQQGGPIVCNRTLNNRSVFIGMYSEGGQPPFIGTANNTCIPALAGSGIVGFGLGVQAGALTSTQAAQLGQLMVRMAAASTVNISTTHNSAALASTVSARHGFAQGYETGGVTPAYLASIHAFANTNNPATTDGILVFSTRTVAGTGAQTDRVKIDGQNAAMYAATDNSLDLGLSATRWKTSYVYNVNAATSVLSIGQGGVGYATGAGGAVTQATSRTTGVTLNKVCGQITLFSAAGSATFQSFTVTNSSVAATDSIRVVQASGTDLYQIHVTAVGAGSFKISFATTGGTTTEQPVFNFSVTKSVAA